MTDQVVLTAGRAALMAEVARLSFEASQIAASLDEERFNWQPDSGRSWSVGQCIEHLVRVDRLFLDGIEEAARSAARIEGRSEPQELDPGRLGRWFIASVEPPAERPHHALKKTIPPARCMKSPTLIAFAGEQQRLIELVRDTADLDCNSTPFKNPLPYGLRTFNLSTGMLFLAAHERRHLGQARNVVAQMPAR